MQGTGISSQRSGRLPDGPAGYRVSELFDVVPYQFRLLFGRKVPAIGNHGTFNRYVPRTAQAVDVGLDWAFLAAANYQYRRRDGRSFGRQFPVVLGVLRESPEPTEPGAQRGRVRIGSDVAIPGSVSDTFRMRTDRVIEKIEIIVLLAQHQFFGQVGYGVKAPVPDRRVAAHFFPPRQTGNHGIHHYGARKLSRIARQIRERHHPANIVTDHQHTLQSQCIDHGMQPVGDVPGSGGWLLDVRLTYARQINRDRAMLLACKLQNARPRRPVLWPAVYKQDRSILLAAVFNHVHGPTGDLQLRVPEHPHVVMD